MAGQSHTQGPWVAERSVDEWGVSVIASNEAGYISNPTRGQVCHISVVAGASGDDPERAVANARLIAAAPCLLEAARNMKGLYDTPAERRRRNEDPFYAEAIEGLRAAISKATGEGEQ